MHDLIYCFRMLRKRPSFTVVAVLTLALAIGASTALFSIVNVVVLNPFSYREPSQLYFVRQSLPKLGVQDQFRNSGPEFVDVTKSGIFERVAAFEPVSRNLTGSDEPERIAAAKVSTDFFTMLGVEPMLGRTIAPNEQGPKGERVLVISHGLWQRRFAGDRAVLGQKVALDDEPFTIIGVMPPQFQFDEGQAWFPFPFEFAEVQRGARAYPILGRISANTTVAQVNAANVMTMRINRSPAKSKDGAQNAIFFQSVIDRVKTLPGIEAVGVASHMPFVFTEELPITVESDANSGPQTQAIDTRTVSTDYFTTMQIPLVGGQVLPLKIINRDSRWLS